MAENTDVAEPQEQQRQGPGIFGQMIQFFMVYFLITKGVQYMSGPSQSADPLNKSSPSKGFQSILEENDPFVNFTQSVRVLLSRQGAQEEIIYATDFYYNFVEGNYRYYNLTIPVDEVSFIQYLQNGGEVDLIVEVDAYSSKYDQQIKLTDFRGNLQIAITHRMPIVTKITHNLISGEASYDVESVSSDPISHWIPEMSIYVVADTTKYPAFPPQLAHIQYDKNNHYYPVVDISTFWVLKSRYIPLNETVSEVPLEIYINTQWIYTYLMVHQFEESNQMHQEWGTSTESEFELIKEMFLETNPYFLGLTMIVSLLHTIFEVLAMKNDIAFWKDRDTLKGLSVTTLLYNFVAQIIITLYLLDNENTSLMILLPAIIAIAIDLWKLSKGFDFIRKESFPYVSLQPKESHKQGNTDLYDNEATKYLAYVAFPLFLIYCIYSLYTHSYKSWYSYIVGSLAGFIYVAGFLMMTPQLYINYKLQSVAHLPWKVMTYRALNTIIDDLFSMIISMPTMHRLACFRDDIIFVIYMFQRWKYRVDPNRHYMEDGIKEE